MKGLYIFALVFLMMLAQASAIQYWSYIYEPSTDNVTTRLFTSVTYTTFEKPQTPTYQFHPSWTIFINPVLLPSYNIFGVTSDTFEQSIDSGKPLEFYILYSSYVDDWNTKAPQNHVNYCNFTVFYNQYGTNTSTAVFSDVMTTTTINAKYFVRLNKGDTASAHMDCLFSNNRSLIMPADYTVVMPTWECKACQYYEWNKDFVKLEKAKTLGTYYTQVWSYIEKVIAINYSLIIILFWIFVIVVTLMAAGLLLTGFYWLYLYIARHSR